MARTALFPGSFDPFTLGHASLVERALPLFDRLVIAVGINKGKCGFIPPYERVEALRRFYAHEPRIEVEAYEGLTVDFARQKDAICLLRGVRSCKDFEYEQQIADVNRRLTGIDTVLLLTQPEHACISSSVVRELAHFGHDITPMLPPGLHYEGLNL